MSRQSDHIPVEGSWVTWSIWNEETQGYDEVVRLFSPEEELPVDSPPHILVTSIRKLGVR